MYTQNFLSYLCMIYGMLVRYRTIAYDIVPYSSCLEQQLAEHGAQLLQVE
jgi:hypothetical protein